MKIYILPYTFSNKVFSSKRASGVDGSMLNQFNVLTESDHDVKMFVPFGDLHKHNTNVDHYCDLNDDENVKLFVKQNRDKILAKMISSIQTFKPDVILSSFTIGKIPYQKLMTLGIPIVYNSCAVPGFFSDLNSADLLSDFVLSGHTLTCMSEYHKARTKKYYASGRSLWSFTDPIEADGILYPAYVDSPKTVVAGDGMIRHVSAANKDKQTFFIHELFENSEVFTTVGYLGGKMDEYVTSNLEKYSHKTKLDIPHTEMMETMKHSSVAFVGLASYDTFTITSLEALSNGVPLIVRGYKGIHPAYEMVEPEFRKYIHIYENKQDFVDKANQFMNMTIEERQALADSAYRVMNKKKFEQSLTKILRDSIVKYNSTKKTSIEDFFG